LPENKRPFGRFGDRSSRPKTQTTEDKIRDFILRNSKNGYYTKVSYLIMNLEQQRKKQKSQEFKRNRKQKSK